MSAVLENQEPRTKNPALGSWLAVVCAWLVGGLLFAVALWLRLYMLGYQPLWLDEGRTWAIVTQSRLGTLLVGLLRPTDIYPLYHVQLKPVLRLLGDSEYALRLPSAVAGALAVPALLALGRELRGWVLGLASSLLLLAAPWAIAQAQDAKAYSLVLLTTILLALALARALRINTRAAWLVFAAVALVAPFVHRLLVFSLLGCAVAWSLAGVSWGRGGHPHIPRLRAGLVLAAAAAGLGLVAGIGIIQDVQRAAGQFASVGPLRGAWLTFGQWAAGQWPGTLRRLYLLPFGLLALLGAVRLAWDLRQRRHVRGAIVLLCLGGFPALLFAVLLSWRDFYEPRYLTIVYPFWLLVLGWGIPELGPRPRPLARGKPRAREASPGTNPRAEETKPLSRLDSIASTEASFPQAPALAGVSGSGDQGLPAGANRLGLVPWFLGSLVLCACFYTSTSALLLPERGWFSGAILKEDFRGAVRALAERVHPDDLVIVHPDSIVPLYRYYAPRVASWPLPEPTVYDRIGRGGVDRATELRELDVKIRSDLAGAPRAWLLIAPEHARVVDPPELGDRMGLVGLAFEYGDSNGRLMCGTGNAERAYAGFVGVSLYCNNMPSVDGAIPEPAVPASAVFGGDLRLRGYSVNPFAGGLRAGETLPLTLFWEPLRSLAGTDYVVFVHLTRPDNPTPLVQIDGQPMEGGLPTALWTEPLAQLHDERTLGLRDQHEQPLEPGRYLLRLGVYRRDDGTRLPVSDTGMPVLDDAIVLGEVEILPAAGASGR